MHSICSALMREFELARLIGVICANFKARCGEMPRWA
jgi:hypothetical protein